MQFTFIECSELTRVFGSGNENGEDEFLNHVGIVVELRLLDANSRANVNCSLFASEEPFRSVY